MNYNEIKSEYLKKMIQETSWSSHEEVDDLIKLYEYILEPPKSLNSGMQFQSLRTQYPYEYIDLLMENSPDALEKEITERQSRKKAFQEHRAEEAMKMELSRQEWLKAGGKP
jgi:hypothetical protein